jgi:hypothetical protein
MTAPNVDPQILAGLQREVDRLAKVIAARIRGAAAEVERHNVEHKSLRDLGPDATRTAMDIIDDVRRLTSDLDTVRLLIAAREVDEYARLGER